MSKSDLSRLGAMLEEIGGAALIVIDPITAYLGMTDSHKNAEIRALLSPLADLAAKYRAAIVCVSHFNKSSTNEALMRVTGSLAFVAAARAAFVVAQDPEHESRRLFLPLKNNLGNAQTGLAFTVEPVLLESTQGAIETSRVAWEPGAVTTTAQEAVAPQAIGEERSELDEAKTFLREILDQGAISPNKVKKDAWKAGLAWRTIQRAKTALRVESVKGGMQDGWLWQLTTPEECQETQKSATLKTWHPSGAVGGLRKNGEKVVGDTAMGFQHALPVTREEVEEVVDLC